METQVTILQAILLGLIYWFKNARLGYTFGVTMIFTPLPAALMSGIILGDIETAMIVGASLQMMYLGIIAPGGNIPQDPTLAAIISTTAVIKGGLPVDAALALAVPIGLLGAQLYNVERIINSVWVHMGDKYAETANTRGIYMAGLVYPNIVKIPLYVIPVAIAVYFGTTYIQDVMNVIPEAVLHGLSVAGGMLPAIGFAIVVTVIGRKTLLPYFLAGFFLVQYTGVAIMPLALAGLMIAYLHVLFTSNNNGQGGEINAN